MPASLPPVSLDFLPESLRLLAQQGIVKDFPRDSELIREGEFTDAVFIVLRGSVKAFSIDARNREIIYGAYGPGEYLGEMSLDGGPRSASVVTLEPTTCAVITRRTLREHIRAHPDFAFELLERVIRRIRVLTDNARGLALLDVYGRLVKFLNAHATPAEGGVRVLAPRPTHSELAGRIGSSREMVSRLFKDLEQGGYVAVQDGQLVLLKPLPSSW